MEFFIGVNKATGIRYRYYPKCTDKYITGKKHTFIRTFASSVTGCPPYVTHLNTTLPHSVVMDILDNTLDFENLMLCSLSHLEDKVFFGAPGCSYVDCNVNLDLIPEKFSDSNVIFMRSGERKFQNIKVNGTNVPVIEVISTLPAADILHVLGNLSSYNIAHYLADNKVVIDESGANTIKHDFMIGSVKCSYIPCQQNMVDVILANKEREIFFQDGPETEHILSIHPKPIKVITTSNSKWVVETLSLLTQTQFGECKEAGFIVPRNEIDDMILEAGRKLASQKRIDDRKLVYQERIDEAVNKNVKSHSKKLADDLVEFAQNSKEFLLGTSYTFGLFPTEKSAKAIKKALADHVDKNKILILSKDNKYIVKYMF